MAKAAVAMKTSPSKSWPLTRIKEYPHNPKTHPPAQITLLANLLKKFGADQDIVVDDKGVILKGHGRKLAAAEAGMKDFPVTQRFGLSEDDKIALRIADNQVPLLGGWDNELVRFEIERLRRSDYPIELLGFGEQQLVEFTTIPGPPAGGFAAFGEDIDTEHECPKCHYRWSGKATPEADGDKPSRKAKAKPEKSAKKK